MNNLKFKLQHKKTQSGRVKEQDELNKVENITLFSEALQKEKTPSSRIISAGEELNKIENMTLLSKALKKISIDMAMHKIRINSSISDIEKNNNIIFGEITYQLYKLKKKTKEDFEFISMQVQHQLSRNGSKQLSLHEFLEIEAAEIFTRQMEDYLNIITYGAFDELSDYYKSDNIAYIIIPDYNYNVVDGKSNQILTADELSLYLNKEGKHVRVANYSYLDVIMTDMVQHCLDLEEEEKLYEVKKNNQEEDEEKMSTISEVEEDNII